MGAATDRDLRSQRFTATHDLAKLGVACVYKSGDDMKQIGTPIEVNSVRVRIRTQSGKSLGPDGGWRYLHEVSDLLAVLEEGAGFAWKIVCVDPAEKARMRGEGTAVRCPPPLRFQRS